MAKSVENQWSAKMISIDLLSCNVRLSSTPTYMADIKVFTGAPSTMGPFKLSSNQLIPKLDMSFQYVYHDFGNVNTNLVSASR